MWKVRQSNYFFIFFLNSIRLLFNTDVVPPPEVKETETQSRKITQKQHSPQNREELHIRTNFSYSVYDNSVRNDYLMPHEIPASVKDVLCDHLHIVLQHYRNQPKSYPYESHLQRTNFRDSIRYATYFQDNKASDRFSSYNQW